MEQKTENTQAPEETRVKLCAVECALSQETITLLSSAPELPYNRALAQAQLRQKLPDELKDWPAIKDWIEHNIDLQRPVAVPTLQSSPIPVTDPGALTVSVTLRDTEHGTARYSVARRGSGEVEIHAEDIRNMLRASVDHGENMDGLMEAIDNFCWEQVQEDMPDMEWAASPTYYREDPPETDNLSTRLDEPTRMLVLRWLQQHEPRLLEALTANDEPSADDDDDQEEDGDES